MANWEDAPSKSSGGWEDAPVKAQTPAGFSAPNLGLAALAGLTGGAKGITDVFGANNYVSRKLGEAEQYLEEAKTPERKAEIARRRQIEEEANKSGDYGKMASAYLGAFKEAPLETLAGLGGAAAPFILGGGQSLAARAALTGIGAAMGAGSAKGAIYDSVYNASRAAGDSEEVARAKADKEQSYSEHPLGIATAAGLGIGSAVAGAAQTANAAIRKRLGQEVAEKAVDSYTKSAAKEATAMGAQSAQQQALQNQALTGAGYQTPTGQGVLGAGLTGAISGAAFGAGAKFLHPNVKEVQKTEGDIAPEIKPTDPLAKVDPNTSYADLHKELASLRSQEQTPEVQTRAALIADHIKDRDIAALQQERTQQQQEQADAQKAAGSAFTQPNQRILSRTEPETQASIQAAQPAGPRVQGDLFADQNLPTEAPPTTTLATVPPQTPQAPIAVQPNQYQYKAPLRNQIKPADLPVPQPLPTKTLGEMIIKPEDITNTGVEHGPGVARWMQDNIVGRTLPEVQDMVKKDPTLLSGKGQRTQVLKELLNPAPEVAPYKEAPNVARPVSEPIGTSAVVASQPDTGTTTAKPAGVESSGVAVAQQPAGKPVVGEGPQPGALTPVTFKGGDREAGIRDRLQQVINDQTASKAQKRAAFEHMDNLDKTSTQTDDAHNGKMNLVEDYLNKYHPAEPTDEQRQAEAAKVQAALAEAQKPNAPAIEAEPTTTKTVAAPATTAGGQEDLGHAPRMNPFEAAAKREPLYTEEQYKARDARLAAKVAEVKNPNMVGAEPATNVEAPLQGHIAHGDVRAALEAIANHTGDVYNSVDKLVADRLLKAKSLPTVEVMSEGVLGKDAEGNKVAGNYDAVNDHVRLNQSHVGGATLLHELVHGFLHRLISAHEGGSINHPAVRGLQDVYNHVKKSAPKLADIYGMKDLSEFASEVMSNKHFQHALEKIPYQRMNAFTAFAKKVLQALGVQPNDKHTALAAALIHAESGLSEGRKLQEQSKGLPVEGALTSKPNQVVPASIERDAAYLKPKETSAIGAVKSMYQGSKTALTGPKEVGTITKVRTQVTDAYASVKSRIQEAYDQGMMAKLGKADPRITVQQAKDTDRMLQPIFERGGLEINPVTRQLEVTDAAGKPKDILNHVKDYAAATGRDYETAYANASHILEGLRVADLIKQNATQGTEFVIHKGWRNADGSFNTAKIKDAETAYRNSPELQKINKIMDEFRIRLVDLMEKTGRLNEHDAKVWREVSHYVPFDREGKNIEAFAKTFTGSKRTGRKGLAQLGALPKLIGSYERSVGNVFESYYKTMGWMVDQVSKQNANSHMLDTLVDLSIGKNIGMNEANSQTGYTAPIYRKGVKEFVDLPSAYDALPFVDKAAPKRWYVAAMGKVAPVTRKFVTANPAFAAKQVFEDVQGALITSNVHNPARFIAESFGNFGRLTFHELKGYAGDLTGRTSKVHDMERQMRNMGLAGEVDYTSYNPGETMMYDMGIRTRGPVANLIHRLERITHGSDLAVRKALYDDEFRKSQDSLMATQKARELINFRNSGANTLMRDLVSVVPFLNSTAQSLDIMYRAATGVDAPSGLSRDAAKALFRKNMAIYAGMALAYAMAKSGDEEYEKMNRRMRDNNWVVGDGVRIPIRGDMAIAKVAIENAVGYFHRQGTPEEQLASEAVKTAMAYAWSQTGERVAAAPIPLAVRPLLEIVTNHSFLTGRELEGTYQQTLMPHERQNNATSFPAKALSNAIYEFTKGQFGLDISPIKIDQAVNGYFGAVPAVVNLLTDSMLNPGSVDRPMSKWMGISGYAYDESNLSNPVDEFYNLQERTLPVLKTLQDLTKRDPEKAMQFAQDHQQELALAKPVQHALSELSKIRQYENILKSPRGAEIEPNMAERQRQLTELARTRNEMVGWVREAEKMVRQ